MPLSKMGPRARVTSLVVLAAVAVGGVQVVQALAGGSPSQPDTLKEQIATFRSALSGHGTSRASARSAGAAATTISCGQSITANVTLTEDLECNEGGGVSIDKPGVVFNLGGHTIATQGGGVGVDVRADKVTVQNGNIIGFAVGVDVRAAPGTPPDQVKLTKLLLGYNDTGIVNNGTRTQVTTVTAADNIYDGIADDGALSVIKGSRFVSNAEAGLLERGPGALISGNTASSNGNAGQGYGIYVANTYPQAGHVSAASTITGNTVNFNIGYGIYAQVPMVDGGKNVAKGNSQLVQCVSVACG